MSVLIVALEMAGESVELLEVLRDWDEHPYDLDEDKFVKWMMEDERRLAIFFGGWNVLEHLWKEIPIDCRGRVWTLVVGTREGREESWT